MTHISPIIENDYLTCHFPDTGLIPGYVIVSLKGNIYSIDQLDQAGRKTLIDTLAALHSTIKAIINPERIYTLSIGEIEPRLHFHIFPRTQNLLTAYQTQNNLSTDEPVSGMHLFEWARKAYKNIPFENHTEINKQFILAIRSML